MQEDQTEEEEGEAVVGGTSCCRMPLGGWEIGGNYQMGLTSQLEAWRHFQIVDQLFPFRRVHVRPRETRETAEETILRGPIEEEGGGSAGETQKSLSQGEKGLVNWVYLLLL
jgi:hypothetical protein